MPKLQVRNFKLGHYRNFIYDALKYLAIAAAAATFYYLRERGSELVSPLLYGFAGAASMAVLIAAIQYLAAARRQGTPVNAENIESHVRKWLDAFGYGVQRADNEECKFRMRVNSSDQTRTFFVAQPIRRPQYVSIAVIILPAADVQEAIGRLSNSQKEKIIHRLRLEFVRQRFEYQEISLDKIPFGRSIPITKELTEDVFMRNVQEFEGAMASTITMIMLDAVR